jgi:hypothetical protein
MAKEAFARHGGNASLDDNANQVDVGSGTLYRDSPTSEELLQVLYRTQLEKLAAAEHKFSQTMAPSDAMRASCFCLLWVGSLNAVKVWSIDKN